MTLLLLGFQLATARGQPPLGVDLFGVPLPAGAVARLQSAHLRARAVKDAEVIRLFNLLGNGEQIVVQSGDGRLLASARTEGAVRFWDPLTGDELPHRGAPIPGGRHIALSHDGGKMLVNERVVYALPSGKQLCELEAVRERARPPVFAPDGLTLYGIAAPDTLICWETATGKVSRRHGLEAGTPEALALSPDGKMLAVGCREGQILLLQADTWKETRSLEGHLAHVSVLRFSADGKHLASEGDDHTIRLWDPVTGKEVGNWPATGMHRHFAFSPCGKALAHLGKDGLVVRAVPGGKVLGGHEGFAWAFLDSFVLTRDAAVVYWAEGGPALAMARVQEKMEEERRTPLQPFALAFTADGKHLLTAGGGRLWRGDAASGSVGKPVALADSRARVVLGVNGNWLAIVDGKQITTGNTAGKREQAFAAPGAPWEKVALSGDGGTVALEKNGRVVLLDAATGQVRQKLAVGAKRVTALALDGTGKQLATAGADSVVRLWDTAQARELARAPVLDQRIGVLAFSPDGQRLAAGEWAGGVRLWNLPAGPKQTQMVEQWRRQVHKDNVAAVAFDPDGKTVASGGWDRLVILSEAATGTEARRFEGHVDEIAALAFAADGTRLASGSRDATVLVWKVR
jgi:WD40 repeat protein